MRKKIINVIKIYIPLAATVTAVSGLVYLTVQQDMRQTANDPQVQLAEDLADQLSAGRPVGPTSLAINVDMEKSLSPYIIIYDDFGKPITGSGQLNGNIPTLPASALDRARNIGEYRVTWQPQSNVRSALVIVRFSGNSQSGYVAVGRSLREVERRITILGWQVLCVWFATMVAILILISIIEIVGIATIASMKK